MKHRWSFLAGPKWQYDGENRSFLAYLRSASRRPGFMPGIAAATLFAAAGYNAFGLARGMEVYLGCLALVLLVGYLVWRRGGRR